jgi:hypothetical protein
MILPVLVLGAATVLAGPMALYDQALQAREQHDVSRFLELTRQLTDWAPANPPLRFLHAEALAMSGRTGPAIVELRWLATHGYHYAFWERGSFASLPADPATTALREATTRNGQPSGLLAQVIRIDPADLDAEGIDAAGSEWILGSMANGSLYRVDRAGTATQVWRETAPSRRMLGVRNDAARKVVWACSTGPNDAEPQSELLRISLQPGRVERFRLPDSRTLCNDVALLPDGTVAISDSQRGAIWQLATTGTWRTLAGPGTFGYPNGLTWLDAAQRLVVTDLRGLWTIDLASARIAAERPASASRLAHRTDEGCGACRANRDHRVQPAGPGRYDDGRRQSQGSYGTGRTTAGAARQLGLCRRLIRLRRKTLLKRSWHAADDCSSSVELTFISVTGARALIVASRFAPRT